MDLYGMRWTCMGCDGLEHLSPGICFRDFMNHILELKQKGDNQVTLSLSLNMISPLPFATEAGPDL
eukprot:182327-Chlamydomonas_euryale.AAC.8